MAWGDLPSHTHVHINILQLCPQKGKILGHVGCFHVPAPGLGARAGPASVPRRPGQDPRNTEAAPESPGLGATPRARGVTGLGDAGQTRLPGPLQSVPGDLDSGLSSHSLGGCFGSTWLCRVVVSGAEFKRPPPCRFSGGVRVEPAPFLAWSHSVSCSAGGRPGRHAGPSGLLRASRSPGLGFSFCPQFEKEELTYSIALV